MRNLLKRYGLLTLVLGSLLTGVQIFGPAFLVLWLMNEIRIAILLSCIAGIAWLLTKL